MAKKKSSRKPVKRLKVRLDTSFDCPFCNHNQCIVVSLDKRINMIGSLHCNKCNVNFESKVNVLSEPVDVYTDWIDAVEAVNDPKNKNTEKDTGVRRAIGSDSDDSDDSDLYDSDSDDEKSASVKTFNNKRSFSDEDEDEDDEDFVVKDDEDDESEDSGSDNGDKPVIKKRKVVIEDDED
ncbi:hypothetical protein QEN19_001298 [Hanseniaspora menglaensis]